LEKIYAIAQIADLLLVSKQTAKRWRVSEKLKADQNTANEPKVYAGSQVFTLDKDGTL